MGQGAAIFGVAGPVLTPRERAFFHDYDPLGFILFSRNIEDPDQLCRLTADLRDAVDRNAPVLIDQEGGRVARLRPPHWRDWPAPLDQAERAADPTRALYLRYRIIADELRAVGIDVNCAPCADIAFDETHPFLHNRCYGTTAQDVITRARAVADAHLAGGILPVLKHIPGHGRATADSHLNLPRVDADSDTLRAADFSVYAALKDLPMGMTAHVVYAGLGVTTPTTTSPKMISLIRNELGFDGLLLTDDLSMNALSGTVTQRSAAALSAGVDVILHCNGDLEEMQLVADAAGTMSSAAQPRADRALSLRHPPDDADISALVAELKTLYKPRNE